MELDESKVGRLDHKIQKLKNMQFVVGIEACALKRGPTPRGCA